jgi:putative intracellular protease/amidase
MARILMPLPRRQFDPTESAVPWKILTQLGHEVIFATPDGQPGAADERMLAGAGLGIWKPLLIADANGRAAYTQMAASAAFGRPHAYDELAGVQFHALLLPGGHAPGMREYLESRTLQALVVAAFDARQPVGAICHGVLLAARSRMADGRSVLYGRKTTALTRQLELTAWALTALWLGSYYRTYPQTVQAEVSQALAGAADFVTGPFIHARDAPGNLAPGFALRDGNYLSARWPGDAHQFAHAFARMLAPAA